MADKVHSASTTAPVNIAADKCVLTFHPPTQLHQTPASSSSPTPLPPITPKSNLSNISLNRYYSKRNTKPNPPNNASLARADPRRHTTAAHSSTFTDNSLWLNGEA